MDVPRRTSTGKFVSVAPPAGTADVISIPLAKSNGTAAEAGEGLRSPRDEPTAIAAIAERIDAFFMVPYLLAPGTG